MNHLGLLGIENLNEVWPQIVHAMTIKPGKDDVVARASMTVEDAVDLNNLTGNELHRFWQQIVTATHIDTGNPHFQVKQELFTPPDLRHFLAVRCRAVSAVEKHGPNVNGDAIAIEHTSSAVMET